MPLTLLQLCENVADQVGVARPAAIVGSTDRTAKRMLGLLTLECKLLTERHAWSALNREATITTTNGTASYPVESDFDRIIDHTVWDATNYWEMRGSLTPAQWQRAKRSIAAQPTNRRRFRVKWDTVSKAREVFIDPTPTATGDSLVYEYVSINYCQATGGGALKSAWSVDTDVPLLRDTLVLLGLVWRYRNAVGLPYAEEKNEYEHAVASAIDADMPAQVVDLAQKQAYYANLTDGNYGL